MTSWYFLPPDTEPHRSCLGMKGGGVTRRTSRRFIAGLNGETPAGDGLDPPAKSLWAAGGSGRGYIKMQTPDRKFRQLGIEPAALVPPSRG